MNIPLKNAEQSTTYTTDGCAGNLCTANKAIDGNLATQSVTRESQLESWSAELEELSSITKILVYANSYALGAGKYSRFKVEVKTSQNAAWKVCKAEHAMQAPHDPNEVICEKPMIAKYVKLSVAGGPNLYLNEVKVLGSILGKSYRNMVCEMAAKIHFKMNYCRIIQNYL